MCHGDGEGGEGGEDDGSGTQRQVGGKAAVPNPHVDINITVDRREMFGAQTISFTWSTKDLRSVCGTWLTIPELHLDTRRDRVTFPCWAFPGVERRTL